MLQLVSNQIERRWRPVAHPSSQLFSRRQRRIQRRCVVRQGGRMRHMLRVLLLVGAVAVLGVSPAAGASSAPIRLGYCGGDDWEPAFAQQGSYVYDAITHYSGG